MLSSAHISPSEPAAVIRHGCTHQRAAGKPKDIRNDGLCMDPAYISSSVHHQMNIPEDLVFTWRKEIMGGLNGGAREGSPGLCWRKFLK